ncbi:unnamed protein product [Arctia plantaginis]|uniref:Uncharacterized protein n=1 Tax=Arctia plantaginis TaxID=874455 RepID=A0A8S0YS84_ARCPL|nr:unnamed protein product [Arctia plantaginis]
MTPSVIKYFKKRSPSKKKTNEVTVYLMPTNNKVIGKCLTDIRNHGHYIQCGTSESKKLCSEQFDEESLYMNCGLRCISRPESSEMLRYSPCKVIFENEAIQTPSKLSIPALVSILKPDWSYVVTDKKILFPPFKVKFKKKSAFTQCVNKKCLKTKPLAPCIRFKSCGLTNMPSKIITRSSSVTIRRPSKVKFEEKLQLSRFSPRNTSRHRNDYQTSVKMNKMEKSEIVGNLELSNVILSKEASKSIARITDKDCELEKLNVIIEKKVSKVKSSDGILQQTCDVPSSKDDNGSCLITSDSWHQESHSFCNTICINTYCDGMFEVVRNTSCSEPQRYCGCDCSYDHIKDRKDCKNTTCECKTQTFECDGACQIEVEETSTPPKNFICKIELNKRIPAINDGSDCCMHIIDVPDLITVVVHDTSSSSRSAGYVASSSFFTDYSILDRSRRLKMRRMLLKQQELTLVKVEEIKKNKSLKKYVSDRFEHHHYTYLRFTQMTIDQV